jgi:hypothetical protein
MKNLFNDIDSSEKDRILEMHKKQGYVNINEQPDSKFDIRRPATPKPSVTKPTTPKTGVLDNETGGATNDVLENPLYQNFYNDIMGVGVDIISKSSNSIKIDGPTGVWTLSKSNA